MRTTSGRKLDSGWARGLGTVTRQLELVGVPWRSDPARQSEAPEGTLAAQLQVLCLRRRAGLAPELVMIDRQRGPVVHRFGGVQRSALRLFMIARVLDPECRFAQGWG